MSLTKQFDTLGFAGRHKRYLHPENPSNPESQPDGVSHSSNDSVAAQENATNTDGPAQDSLGQGPVTKT
jgi:hypothetical protein